MWYFGAFLCQLFAPKNVLVIDIKNIFPTKCYYFNTIPLHFITTVAIITEMRSDEEYKIVNRQ